jgi:hypothetical protein
MLGAKMRRPTRATLGLLATGILTIATIAPLPARSQTAEDKAAAEALFDEGKKLLADKRYAEACTRFESSQRLDPGIGTLLFLADCYENVGRIASAWSTFREAAAAAKAAGQASREKTARERAAKLEGKLFQLTLAVAGASTPGLRVMRDETAVKKEVWGLAVPVDPGTYKLTVTATGKKPYSTTLEIPVGAGSRTVEIPALEDAPAEPPAPTAAPTAAPTTTVPPVVTAAPPAPPAGWSGGRIAGLTMGILGIAGVGAGAAIGGIAASQFSDVKARCPNTTCGDTSAVDLSKQVGALADVSTALFVAGGAVLAGGVVLFLVSPSPAAPKEGGGAGQRRVAEAAPRTVWMSPILGNGAAGLRAGSTF